MRIRAAVLFCLFAGIANAQSTIRPGGGGGSSTITAGTTATSGCTDGGFLYSLTSLIRCGALMTTNGTDVYISGGLAVGSSTVGAGYKLSVTGGGINILQARGSNYINFYDTTAAAANWAMYSNAAGDLRVYKYTATAGDAVIFGSNGAVTFNKTPVYASTVPAVSNTSANSCGTTAATIAGTSETGIVTVGATSGTSCTVTFAVAAPTRRQCVVNNETTGVAVKATYSSTTVSLFAGTFAASDVLAYICSVY